MNRFINKDINRIKLLIIISVAVLTIVTLNISYSAFFSVQSQSTVQQIKAGVLDVTIDNSTYISDNMLPTEDDLLPTSSNSTEDQSQLHGSLTLHNEGTLEAAYSITIEEDEIPNNGRSIDYQYVNVGIVDVSSNTWHNFGTEQNPVYYTALTNLGSDGIFPVLRDTIATSMYKQYRIYLWLAEETPVSEVAKYIYLKLNVKSTTVNGNIAS